VAWLAAQVSRFVSGRAKGLRGKVLAGQTELSAAKCGLVVAHHLLADRARGKTVHSSLTDDELHGLCARVDSTYSPPTFGPGGSEGSGGGGAGGVRVRGITAHVAAMYNIIASISSVDPVVSGEEMVRRYFSVYAATDTSLGHYIQITSGFVADKTASLARQRIDLARATSSSSSLAEIVQQGNRLAGAIATSAGSGGGGSSSSGGSSGGSSNATALRWGSKLAALLEILKPQASAVSSSSSSSSSSISPQRKVIVFSMFSDALSVCSLMLNSEAIPHAMIHGANNTAKMKSQALARFGGGGGGGGSGGGGGGGASFPQSEVEDEEEEVDVLLLSSAASASGANLQAASVVVFLDPPGKGSALDGASLERQAVGRAVRMGQIHETVTVIRLCAAGTLEQELWRGVRAAAVQEEAREQGPAAAAYVVERAQASAAAQAASEAASKLDAEKEAKDDGILGCVQVTVADAVAAKFAAVAAAGEIIEICDDTDDDEEEEIVAAEPVAHSSSSNSSISSSSSNDESKCAHDGRGTVSVKVEAAGAIYRDQRGQKELTTRGKKRGSSPSKPNSRSSSRLAMATRSKHHRISAVTNPHALSGAPTSAPSNMEDLDTEAEDAASGEEGEEINEDEDEDAVELP
jgi:hypothetical protein